MLKYSNLHHYNLKQCMQEYFDILPFLRLIIHFESILLFYSKFHLLQGYLSYYHPLLNLTRKKY